MNNREVRVSVYQVAVGFATWIDSRNIGGLRAVNVTSSAGRTLFPCRFIVYGEQTPGFSYDLSRKCQVGYGKRAPTSGEFQVLAYLPTPEIPIGPTPPTAPTRPSQKYIEKSSNKS